MNITDENVYMVLLMDLPPSFGNLFISLESMSTKDVDLQFIVARLLHEMSKRKECESFKTTAFVATLALGSRPKQRACKGVSQEEAQKSKQEEEARESHHKLPGVLESVREYEGMNPHTPKATPTLGDGVLVDF
jgi:hypothetical protein